MMPFERLNAGNGVNQHCLELGPILIWDGLRSHSPENSTTSTTLMGHLSLGLHNASLSQSATLVTPSRTPFCYTSGCRPAIWQEQTGKGSRCEQHSVTLIVCRTLRQLSAYEQCVYD